MAEGERGAGLVVDIPPGPAKIVIAPPDIDISPRISIAMPRSPYVTYFAMSRAMQAVQDVAMKLLVAKNVDILSDNIPLMLSHNFGVAFDQKWGGPEGDIIKLREALVNDYKGLYANWRAGVGHGVGTTYSSAMEQFLGTGQLLYAYKSLMYQVAVTPRMRRHWNAMFTPTVPNTSMAYSLWLRGEISETQFKKYASYDGWPTKDVDLLKTVWKAVPTPAAAWRFLQRGQISGDEFKDYVHMSAWPEGWAEKFLKYYESLPTARQAFDMRQRGIITTTKKHEFYGAAGYSKDIHNALDGLFTSIPTLSEAARMYLRNALTAEGYGTLAMKRGYDMWTAARLFTNSLSYPTTREAFYMDRRGIIDRTTRDRIYKADGYLEDWWPLITENYTHIPTPINAFKLLKRFHISRKQFNDYVYMNGWPREFASHFYALHENTPTSHEAFFMWKKGLINVDARNTLYSAYGWDRRYWELITKNYEYVPTLYDLFRLADYVEVDAIWATEIMKKRGLADADIAKLLPMIRIRALRDEVRRQVYIWVNRYKLGWCDATQLEAALDAMLAAKLIQVTEKTLITEEAELEYEDELLRESIRILMWRFRMGAITEEAYLADLLSLGIRREKANLMVAEQTAMGYYGYAY